LNGLICIWIIYCTYKNHRKNWRKRQKVFPNFLKMRIFLSKLANNSPFSTKIFSLSFSHDFLTIFVSVLWVDHSILIVQYITGWKNSWRCECYSTCLSFYYNRWLKCSDIMNIICLPINNLLFDMICWKGLKKIWGKVGNGV